MTREYIIETCIKYSIENYTINADLSIDVKGNVNLYSKGSTELPLTFNIVDGVFNCGNNNLTNLKGAPRKCKSFYCYGNKLTSLEGAPDECIVFSCINNINNLTSLKGIPKCIYILIDYNKLNLDNEELYIIEALIRFNNNSNYLDEELENYYFIRYRNEIINSVLY